MYDGNRSSERYLSGVSDFIRAAEEHKLNRPEQYICCPCKDCENVRMFENPEQIEDHLIRRGFIEQYTCWTRHGEQQTIQECGNDDIAEEEAYVADDVDCDSDEETSSDDRHHLDEMLRHAEGNRNTREYEKFKLLMGDSEKPLFEGCKGKYTKLSSVLELLKLKASNGWSDKSFT